MAERKLYIGSFGPFLYDDDVAIDDPDGDFPGEDQCAVVTSGQLYVEAEPTRPNHIARLTDLQNLILRVYPIGIVILTANNTNPSTLGIPGTWVAFE